MKNLKEELTATLKELDNENIKFNRKTELLEKMPTLLVKEAQAHIKKDVLLIIEQEKKLLICSTICRKRKF